MRIKSKEFDFLSLWMCFVSKVTGDEAEGGEGEKPFLEKIMNFSTAAEVSCSKR